MFGLTLRLLPFLLSMALNSAGDNSDASDDSDNTGDAPGKPGGSESRTFTQADVDRIFNERLNREKRKLAEELRDEIRQELESEAERQAREEAEEFKPLYEAEKAAKEAAERRIDEVANQFRTRLAKVEIEKAATEVRLAAPALAHRLIDFDQITFNDDDEPTNIPALVKALAEANPDLVKPESPKRPGVPDTPNPDTSSQPRASQAYLEKRYGRAATTN